MDYSKLADEFIEEGAWQGTPVIAVSMFAKWLEEREAAQQTLAPDAATLCPECGRDMREGHKYLCHLR